MGTIQTVLISILVFGCLILIHELGHYITARIFKVTITEFSIGMGPKLLWYDSKKTGIKYALSAIPFGGYVAMVGEDGESDDPNAFNKKPAWQRLIIIVAGAMVNIIAGFIAMIIVTIIAENIGGTTIHSFVENEEYISSKEYGLMEGDEIIEIDGKRVYIADEVSYEIMRRGDKPIDILVLRNGEEKLIEDVQFATGSESGQVFGLRAFYIVAEPKTFGSVISYSFIRGWMYVRMCWESIFDLITGRYSVEAISGPVGISQAIGEAANDKTKGSLLSMVALISINLGVMNLLPLPALDGGRLIMILAEMITRKKIPAKIEATINAVGLMILLGLSVIIMIKDIFGLFV